MTVSSSQLSTLQSTLVQHEQEHLLEFWDVLTPDQRLDLFTDLASIDFEERCRSFTACSTEEPKSDKEMDLQALPDEFCESVNESQVNNERWTSIGLKEISEGKTAMLLLAGGQGTRLGVPYPKGMFKVGLPSGKSLYQLQAERISRQRTLAEKMYGTSKPLPWYIMTSEQTKEPTIDFFKTNNWFGLEEENIVFFEQEMLPCVDFFGKLMLQDKFSVARAPGGNGDLYRAMGKEGVIDDMHERGIRSIHMYCVDNILVKMPDPLFIGCCLERGSDCGAKVVRKTLPTEPVGVICQCEGRLKVVEYSEITTEAANLRNADGKLAFSQGSICIHYFTLDFLKRMVNSNESELIHHIAKKKITCVNKDGESVTPDKPNGIKMEKFVFDVFRFSERFTALEVPRESEFSPLKNGAGSAKDNQVTCLSSVSRLHKAWVEAAGGEFVIRGGEENVEVSPTLSSNGEDLEDLVQGKKFSYPLHLSSGYSNVNGHENGHINKHANGFNSKL